MPHGKYQYDDDDERPGKRKDLTEIFGRGKSREYFNVILEHKQLAYYNSVWPSKQALTYFGWRKGVRWAPWIS